MAAVILSTLYLGWFGFALSLVVFVAITLPNVARRLSRSRLTVKAYQDFAYADVKCPHCTVGVQVLTKKGWGKIPMHIRIAQEGSRIFHPRQANIRNCPECSGKGFRPVKIIKGHSEREEIAWPPPGGGLMSDEPVYRERPGP
jgi:hypothetical protein